MSLGSTLIIIGSIIGFIAFCFAAVNLFWNIDKGSSSGFNSLFKRHIVAVIAMAFGGLLFIIGLILYSTEFLNRIIS